MTVAVDEVGRLAEEFVDGLHVGDAGLRLLCGPLSYEYEDCGGHCCGSEQERPDPVPVHERVTDLAYVPVTLLLPGLRTPADDAFLLREQQGDALAERPDVGPVVDREALEQFRGSERSRTGRSLVDGPGIGIGEAEVDELDIGPVVGDEDVRRLDVPVDDLLGMQVGEGVAELENNLPGCGLGRKAVGDEGIERNPVDPFHLDAVAKVLAEDHPVDFPDGRVGEAVADFVFLAEQGLVAWLAAEGWFEGFQDAELSILVDAPDFGPPAFGTMDELRFGKTALSPVSGLVGKECGIFWHGDSKVRIFDVIAAMMRIVRHIFLVLSLFLAADLAAVAQDKWDAVLDRYEMIAGQCKALRDRIEAGETVPEKSVTDLLSQLNRMRTSLQQASGSMTDEQKARYKRIRDSYLPPAAPASAHPLTAQTSEPHAARDSRPETASPVSRTTSKEVSPTQEPARNFGPVVAAVSLAAPLRPVPIKTPVRDIPMPAVSTASLPAGPSTRTRPWTFDLAAIAAYGDVLSYGFHVSAAHGGWGCYVSARSNFVGTASGYSCLSDGSIVGGGRFWGTGEDRQGVLSITGGAVRRFLPWLDAYAGLGYGRSILLWEDTGHSWAKVDDYSASGLVLDGGLLFRTGRLRILGGVSWLTTLQTSGPAFTFGLGLGF